MSHGRHARYGDEPGDAVDLGATLYNGGQSRPPQPEPNPQSEAGSQPEASHYSSGSGYAGDNGHPDQYSADPRFAAPPGYAPDSGYAPDPGYAADSGYAAEPEYSGEASYTTDPGYSGQTGYSTDNGHYPTGYVDNAPYTNDSFYTGDTPYTGDTGYARDAPTVEMSPIRAEVRRSGGAPAAGGTDAKANTAKVMRSSGVMALGTAVSRILGFVRAAVLIAAIAPGPAADAFSVANTIPNALYILLAGGVLNAVLVPQITRAAKQLDGGQEYIDRLLTATVSILFVVTIVFTLAAPLLIKIYASGSWSPAQTRLAVAFALWCLPQIFWYGIYTILGQVLNARGSFGPFMWAPVVNNVVAIAGLAVFMMAEGRSIQPIDTWSAGKIALLAGTATLGVVAQAVVLIPAMKKAGINFKVRWGLRGFGLRTASRVAGWTFGAIVVQQLGYIVISQVTTAAGSRAADGSHVSTGTAIYVNAFLLFMLPHSLIAVSLVTALFTRMSVSAADNRIDDVRSDLSLGLRLTGLATVLSAVAFLAIGPDISAALFAGSSKATTDGIAYVAMAMMIGLVPFSAQYLFQRVFYAFEDAKTPFMVQVPIVIIWALGNLLSLAVLPSHLIVVGVGISMTVANTTGAVLSFYLLHRRFGDLDGQRVLRTHVRMLAAAAAGGVVAFILAHGVHGVLGSGWLPSVVAAGVGGLALIGIYVLGLRQLKVTELDDALLPLIKRR